MMMRSNVKHEDINSEANSQCSYRDDKIKVIAMPPENRQQPDPIKTEQTAMIMVILVVFCLHAGLLFLILNSSSVQQNTVTTPTISGVFIQAPSTEVVKAPKKKLTPKPKSKPKPKPKPKPTPVAKRAITPPPVEKKPPAPEVQETSDTVKENIDVEHKPAPIVAPRVDATRQSNPSPLYPRGSLRRNEQGKVILELLILADGSVGEVRIEQSSGFKRLDRAAMKAVKRWRYIPAQQGDKAIEYWYQQPITFALRQ